MPDPALGRYPRQGHMVAPVDGPPSAPGISAGDDAVIALRQRIAELTETNRTLTEAVEARDALLAIAGHELRNPMTPILGRVDMLRRLVGQPDFPREKVSAGLEHLEWLVGRFVGRAAMLLDVSRITSNRLELASDPVDVGALASQVVENFRPLAATTGTALTVEIGPDQTVVIGDALALEVIMDNLVSNALKYGVGKPVVLSVASDRAAQTLDICVRDKGPGISPADQTRIFERFERAVPHGEHRGGYGLGLWIVRHLAQSMGGSISIHSDAGTGRSEAGTGSTFCVSLPLHSSRGSP